MQLTFLTRSLTTRLVCYFLLLSLIIVSIAGYLAYIQAMGALKQSVFDRLDAVSTLKENEFDNWVNDQIQNVIMIAWLPAVREQTEILLSTPDSDPDHKAAYTSLSEDLDLEVTPTSYSEETFIIDLNGTVILSTDKTHEGQSLASAPFFSEGLSKTFVQTVYSSPVNGMPTITVVTPLFDPDGQRIGVLASHLSLTRIDRIMMESNALGATGETYLVDRSHTIISDAVIPNPGFPSGKVYSEGIDNALLGSYGDGLYQNYAGTPVIGVYRWDDQQEVALIAEMSQDEAFAPARQLAETIFVLGIILSVLLAVGMYLLARQITRPILAITNTASMVTDGNLNISAPVMTEDEVGELARAFNAMTTNLRQTLDGLEQNVAELKRTEDALRGSEYEYRTLVFFQKEMIDQLPVAVFLKQATDGRYVYWNKTSEDLFGLTAGDIIGKTDREVFPEKLVALFEQEEKQLSRARNSIKSKISSFKHLDNRVIHTIIVPTFDSEGNIRYILGIAEDLTEQNINLKMDLLFSITRHDILDQLTVIMNYLERAQLKDTRDEIQKFFDTTISSVELIRNQISFVRTLQEIGISSPKWQSIEQSFGEALKLMRENNVEIDITAIKNIELFADPLLPRVFYSLLDNSFRHGGNRLTRIRVFHESSAETFKLVYEDNGKGIPADIKEKIFDFGFGTDTGLGLFLTREILAFTGITIKETGEPGKGSRFEMEVPKDKYRFVE
jgi:PAS domain S-box-containing protein